MLPRRIPILLYHGVSANSTRRFSEWVVHPAQFAEQMDQLVARHYTAITLEELTNSMAHGGATLPPKPVVITFDDGFADFSEHALPVLEHRRLRCTLYVTTGYIGGTARWLAPQGEGSRPMLSWEQISAAVSRGVECGAHSHSHPRLDELRPAVARDEIKRSKELLEDRLGIAVNSFAYPHGYWNPSVRRLVEEAGFSSSVAVRKALSSPRDDPFAMARIVVPGGADLSTFSRLLEGRGLPTAPLPEQLRTKAWRFARRTVRFARRSSELVEVGQ
jgi:peptidoglycan/xylan/chitin deacetylase (PgdA/CDA1 family)